MRVINLQRWVCWVVADDRVCDRSGLGEGFPWQRSLLNLLGELVPDSLKLTEHLRGEIRMITRPKMLIAAVCAYLGCFGVEDFFCRKESLHVCYQEEDSGVVQGRELVMQFWVQHLISPLGILHLFLDLDEFRLVPVGVVLHLLDRVPFFIKIYQLPSSLVNLFLQ